MLKRFRIYKLSKNQTHKLVYVNWNLYKQNYLTSFWCSARRPDCTFTKTKPSFNGINAKLIKACGCFIQLF